MENTEQSLEKIDDNYKVPNLEKGIAVIEYLSSRSEGETLQAIKVALDISQTTAYRILNTLVRLDYLSFDEDTKRYKLTRKLLTLGFRSLNEHNLLETVLPHLRALDNEEELSGVICVGAPVLNYTGYPCGSIWISGPKDRLTEEQLRSTVQIVKEIAGQISAELGYRRV